VQPTEAYLDIETIGLSPWGSEITLVGIQVCKGDNTKFITIISDNISSESIVEALNEVEVIYTYGLLLGVRP
ncbi:ribonuclease H-like domain-containing protein, partial [Chloroflexota bacterium]